MLGIIINQTIDVLSPLPDYDETTKTTLEDNNADNDAKTDTHEEVVNILNEEEVKFAVEEKETITLLTRTTLIDKEGIEGDEDER